MSKDRHELLKNTEARMNKDGLEQTIYQVVGRIETELFTKITVSLSYNEHFISMKKKGIITNNVKNNGTTRNPETHSSLQSEARKVLAKTGKNANKKRVPRRWKKWKKPDQWCHG